MADKLPTLIGVTLPSSPLLEPVLAHVRKHTSPSTVNHSIRSAYWALYLATHVPQFASAPPGAINHSLIALGCIMHDLGWATTRSLLSDDKRFEVDGANLAVKFIEDNRSVLESSAEHKHTWDKTDMITLWDAIALHTAPSIAHNHPKPEVVLVQFGIFTDFLGPNLPPPFPPGLLSKDQYVEVLKAFPREGFHDEWVQVFCGLCREKPDTTLDNWQCQIGLAYGTDGKGGGKEEFKKKVDAVNFVQMLEGALKGCKEIEPEEKLSKPRSEREKYWYEAE